MYCSVIVTAYNQVNTIAQTLDSILSQNCNFSFEIIIGDDCSIDGTPEICLEYQKKYPNIIHIVYHEKNVGVAINFVLCVKQAKGKYIALCAADDFWHNPDKLQLQMDYMEVNNDCGLLYTDYDKFNVTTGKTVHNWFKSAKIQTYEGNGLIKLFFAGKVPALTLTVIFRKDLYDKYIPSNDYIKFNFPIEDWPTWLILSKYSKIGYLAVSTATYRYGHESLSNQKTYGKIEGKYTLEKIMYKYLCDMFPDDLYYDEKGYDSYLNGILLNLAYKKRDYKSAHLYSDTLIKLGASNLKIKSARTPLFFHFFWLLKKMKTFL